MKSIIVLLIVVITLISGIFFVSSLNLIDNSQREFNQCLEYEQLGSIPKGSCECTKELFTDFSHSYDWMDACAILNN